MNEREGVGENVGDIDWEREGDTGRESERKRERENEREGTRDITRKRREEWGGGERERSSISHLMRGSIGAAISLFERVLDSAVALIMRIASPDEPNPYRP